MISLAGAFLHSGEGNEWPFLFTCGARQSARPVVQLAFEASALTCSVLTISVGHALWPQSPVARSRDSRSLGTCPACCHFCMLDLLRVTIPDAVGVLNFQVVLVLTLVTLGSTIAWHLLPIIC